MHRREFLTSAAAAAIGIHAGKISGQGKALRPILLRSGSYTYGKLMDMPIFDLLLNSPGAGTHAVNGPQNWRDPSGDYGVDRR